jgi:hypothetical protein
MGDAPNHKFTPYRSERAALIAQDWVPEGSGDGVAFCVPSFHDVAQARAAALAGTTWDFHYFEGIQDVVRVVFGSHAATGDDEFPHEVLVTNRLGLAGFEPYAGRYVVAVLGDVNDTAFVFDITEGGSLIGCAFVTRRLVEGLLGPCIPMTGRQL